MTPYRMSLTTAPSPRRVPWHVRALAWAFRAAWRAGSDRDPWDQQVCRRAAGGVWELRCVRRGPFGPWVVGWYPSHVDVDHPFDIEAVEVWP